MLDQAQLERTLDLWASMWLAEERVHFERALERVVDSDVPPPLKAAAVAACRIIATPRLLAAAERSWWFLEEPLLAEIDATCSCSLWLFTGFDIFFSSSTMVSTALSMPRFRSIGFAPAATFLIPSR